MEMKRTGWFIAINQNNIVNGGCDGTIPCYYKSEKYRKMTVDSFKKVNTYTEVYFLTDSQYTQDVCEMNLGKFIDYIRRNGKRY